MTAKGMPKEKEWNVFHRVGQCTETIKCHKKPLNAQLMSAYLRLHFFLSPKQ